MKELAGLRRELARLKAQVEAKEGDGRGRGYSRFWDAMALASTGVYVPLAPEDCPPGMLEAAERYLREGPPRTDAVEQRIAEVLAQALREQQRSPGSGN